MNNEIKNAAIAVFENYLNAKEVFVTPDEQAFLKEDRARMHNKDYQKVKRSDVMEAEKADKSKKGQPAQKAGSAPAEKSAVKTKEELIAAIALVATIEELDAVEKGEKRGSVLDAIKLRRDELASAIEDNTQTT
jgi:hypothetical protein